MPFRSISEKAALKAQAMTVNAIKRLDLLSASTKRLIDIGTCIAEEAIKAVSVFYMLYAVDQYRHTIIRCYRRAVLDLELEYARFVQETDCPVKLLGLTKTYGNCVVKLTDEREYLMRAQILKTSIESSIAKTRMQNLPLLIEYFRPISAQKLEDLDETIQSVTDLAQQIDLLILTSVHFLKEELATIVAKHANGQLADMLHNVIKVCVEKDLKEACKDVEQTFAAEIANCKDMLKN